MSGMYQCPECLLHCKVFTPHTCDPQKALDKLREVIAIAATHPQIPDSAKLLLHRYLGREGYRIKPEHMKHYAGDWEDRINKFNDLWKQEASK